MDDSEISSDNFLYCKSFKPPAAAKTILKTDFTTVSNQQKKTSGPCSTWVNRGYSENSTDFAIISNHRVDITAKFQTNIFRLGYVGSQGSKFF